MTKVFVVYYNCGRFFVRGSENLISFLYSFGCLDSVDCRAAYKWSLNCSVGERFFGSDFDVVLFYIS